MSEAITAAPTSTAATRETEPEVVAGISSAEGSEEQPLAFRADGPSPLPPLLMLVAAATLGYLGYRWLRWRRTA
ncbi:MAG: hypothetical protein ACM3JG_14300 [Thiohalocapsa sp.]